MFCCSVPEGAVLYLSNYTVRERFQLMSRAKVRARDMIMYDIEVNLNKDHPAVDVKVVDPGIIRPEWNLPDITFAFFSRKEMR